MPAFYLLRMPCVVMLGSGAVMTFIIPLFSPCFHPQSITFQLMALISARELLYEMKFNNSFLRQCGGVSQCSLNMHQRKRRVTSKDFFRRDIGGEIVQNDGNRYAGSLDTSLPVRNVRIGGNVWLPVHAALLFCKNRELFDFFHVLRPAQSPLPPSAAVVVVSARRPARRLRFRRRRRR